MKAWIWAGLLVSSAAGAAPECTQTSREHYVEGWEDVSSVENIHQRITPGGVIDCRYLPDRSGQLNILARYELGTLDGAGYKVQYSDGSGLIQGLSDQPVATANPQDNWKLNCHTAGTASGCTLHKGDIRVHRDSANRVTLTIGVNPRKGSEWLLRVDTNWAVTAPADSGFSAEQTERLLSELRDGRKADTRYHDDSVRAPISRSMTLYGFSQALAVMDRVLEQLRNPPAAGESGETSPVR
jgi:hypothetical protein